MKLRTRQNKEISGFTIPELMVVMLISGILSGLLIVFYSQSRLTLERGVAKTTLQQKARLASIRVIPKITSTIYRPPSDPTDTSDELLPIVSPLPTDDETSTPPNPGKEITLRTTRAFALEQMRLTVTADDEFNPREEDFGKSYAELRLFFEVEKTDPDLGEIGSLYMEGHFDNDDDLSNGYEDVSDKILIASGLNKVEFDVRDNGTVRVYVEARGFIPNATSGQSVAREVYETDVYLPVNTSK